MLTHPTTDHLRELGLAAWPALSKNSDGTSMPPISASRTAWPCWSSARRAGHGEKHEAGERMHSELDCDRQAGAAACTIRHATDFAYVPDIARAMVTLPDAPEDAFGQVWNMPCAPTRTPREILKLGADANGPAAAHGRPAPVAAAA